MADTNFFLIGCMKRQHAVFLEPIWETDSIITRFHAQRTGLLTPLLTCFTLLSLSLLLEQIIRSPIPFLPFAFWTKIFEVQTSLLSSFSTKSFLSQKFSSLFPSDKNILSPTSILQKNPETFPSSVLAAISFPLRKNILSPIFFLI